MGYRDKKAVGFIFAAQIHVSIFNNAVLFMLMLCSFVMHLMAFCGLYKSLKLMWLPDILSLNPLLICFFLLFQ